MRGVVAPGMARRHSRGYDLDLGGAQWCLLLTLQL